MSTWYTIAEATAAWQDAPRGSDLAEILDAAREQIVEYATSKPFEEWVAPDEETGISIRWRRAHIMQARAIFNAMQAGPGDTYGGETQTVRVYPMDWNVKSLLRPKRAMPGIG